MEAQPSQATALKEIFLEALERTDPGERAAFLAGACGNDEELHRQVEDLLNEQESVGGFLELPVWSASGCAQSTQGETSSGTPREQIGDYIGNYRLVKKLGEGGCGAVYVAQQEEPLRREVALKVVRLGTHSYKVIARFEAERQTLALMDHPNIAKVFDAGTTQNGLPFFVMELIRGSKLTEHCNLNRLGIQERLRLFVQVCLGVHHAHQKGIVHRDLKPSNILVADHEGHTIPKIIDFGIATAIHQELPPDQREPKDFARLSGTPAYMSPEQTTLSDLSLDARSDIYSLGLILHQLLTGRKPLPGQALLDRVLNAERPAAQDELPVHPSTYLSSLPLSELDQVAQDRRSHPAQLVKLLHGDLDCIVMKALEQDRSRRYSTANAFAQDIEALLANEPVLARPATWFYRFEKFARRHQTMFVPLAVIALVLLLTGALSSWLAMRTYEAESQARLSGQMEAQLRREALLARQRATQEANLARQNEYVADINLAQQSLNSGNYGRAIQLLGKNLPERHAPDLRGFEWNYLWQLAHGDDHLQFPAQDSSIRTLTVSPNGEWLAIATDNSLRLWDLASQTLLYTFPNRVVSAVFSPSCQLVASTPTAIHIFNLPNWAETVLSDQEGGALAVSKDGSLLAAADRYGVHLWNTKDWSQQNVLPGAAAPLAFSPDGTVLATSSRDGITLWGLVNLATPRVLKNSRGVFLPRPGDQLGSAITFSADGRYLVAPRNFPSEHGLFVVSIWDVQAGEEIAVLPPDPDHPEHTGTIAGLALSPNGHTLATASMDHSIRLWDLDAHRVLRALHGHLSEVWAAAFSPNGTALFTGAKDGSVNIWPIPPKANNDVLEGRYVPLAFSRDSRRLAALDEEDGAVLFLDPVSRQIKDKFAMEQRSFRTPGRYALSADFKVLAAAHRNHVSLYNTTSRERVEIEVGNAPVLELALSPDGRQLVTGTFGGTFQWWDLSTRTNSVLGNAVRRALFSPDGTTLLLVAGDNRAELWDVDTRHLRTVLTSDLRLGPAVAFSANGHFLAIGSHPLNPEQTINVWDLSTGRSLGTCVGHKQGIFDLAFSADGRTLASASHDSTLKLWNIPTLQQLASFPISGGARNPLFAPDGSLLVLGQSLPQPGIRFYPASIALESETATQSMATP